MPDTMDYKAWIRTKRFITENASPAGVISAFAGISAKVPSGWLLCDGREVSRADYAKLFDVIGVAYGEGNGSTTFNIPDLRGRFPLGLSTSYMLGQTGGETSHILTTNEMPSHTHTQNGHNHAVTVNSGGSHTHTATTSSNGSHSHSGTTASAGAHTHQQNIATQSGGSAAANTDYDGWYSNANVVSQGINTASAGAHTHSFSTNSTGGHTHTLTTSSSGSHNHSGSVGSTTATNQNTGGGQAHNNMPPYLVVNYIIKY